MRRSSAFLTLATSFFTLLATSPAAAQQRPVPPEIRARVGQLFMLAFSGKDPARAIPLIRDRGIGGLYLSNENLQAPAQSARLLNALQDAALHGIARQPLLTACDQEGAWAVMVPHSASGPGNMALGGADARFTREMYTVFGRELSAIGVFLDLAPVSDVNSNPQNPIIGTRSFGEDATRVAEHVSAAIAGLHASGVAATAKHFPGHGNTSTDSHRGLPRVDRDLARIEAVDLKPFRAAVRSGVDVIMTAHIIYTALDPDHPSTMSSRILKDYLRKELGFNGLVITDSFNMDAIRKNFVPGDAAVAAINAGADMIMLAEERYGDDVGDYVRNQTQLLDRVEQAVMSGEISRARLNEAYGRVVALKQKYHLAERLPVNPERADTIVGGEADRTVERAAARASVNVVYDRKQLLPLPHASTIYVTRLTTLDVAAMIAGMRGIGPNYSAGYQDLVRALRGFGYDVREFGAPDDVPDGATIVAVSENYPLPGKSMDLDEQHRRLAGIQAANKGPVIVAGLGAPYEALQVSPDAYVTAVGSNRSNAEALAALLAGRVQSTSVLSVTPIKP